MLQRIVRVTVGLILITSFIANGQESKTSSPFYAGFQTLTLIDTSRIYKPNTTHSDGLHFRPVDLDIWYPTLSKGVNKLSFGDLFKLFEERANRYQDSIDYTGISNELAQFFVIEAGLDSRYGAKLLEVETNSYAFTTPAPEKFPVVIYMAGLNGMGFENFRILERLAERGFVVVSISSVGRYPGDMTNQKLDMLEQVYDAEFAWEYFKSQRTSSLNIDFDNAGILGCSWGGMSAATFVNRNRDFNTVVSLDGSETHYFGTSDDTFIQEIHSSNLLNPENNVINYLYMESDNKLDDYTPGEEYHFYKKLSSKEKYYLRFPKSRHEDFTSIPSALNASPMAVETHTGIKTLTVLFFEKYLKKSNEFKSVYDGIALRKQVSINPFEHDYHSKKTILQGQILEEKTALPLEFVNIGLLKGETGTVSDEHGKYELRIKPGMENDTVRISMIGYKAKMFTVREMLLRSWSEITMEEEVNKLREVIVTSRGLKKKNLGNKTTSKFVSTGFGYDQLGAEIGIRLNVRRPTYLDAFNVHISHNRLSAKALFRLNIYEIENGKPSRNIVTDNILIPIDAKQTGLITVALMDYNIVLQKDVIATLEWVKNEGENKKGEAIYFSLGVFNSGTVVKKSSQGKFKKYSNMGVGINFNVRQ